MSDPVYNYRYGPEPIAALGKMRAFGTRVLCRAILDTDYYKGDLELVNYNAVDAVAFEILSVGAGVAKRCEEMGEEAPRVGQHCDVRSVAADRVHSKDPTGRFWLVPIEDIAAVWDPLPLSTDGLVEACEAVARRNMPKLAQTSTGEALLMPAGG